VFVFRFFRNLLPAPSSDTTASSSTVLAFLLAVVPCNPSSLFRRPRTSRAGCCAAACDDSACCCSSSSPASSEPESEFSSGVIARDDDCESFRRYGLVPATEDEVAAAEEGSRVGDGFLPSLASCDFDDRPALEGRLFFSSPPSVFKLSLELRLLARDGSSIEGDTEREELAPCEGRSFDRGLKDCCTWSDCTVAVAGGGGGGGGGDGGGGVSRLGRDS
jgi:hypothetical protein